MMVNRPTARQQYLSIHLNRRFAAKLSADEVGVVWRVDVVVTERLIHVLVNVQPIKEHWSILIRHQIPTEPVHRHLLCHHITSNTTSSHLISTQVLSYTALWLCNLSNMLVKYLNESRVHLNHSYNSTCRPDRQVNNIIVHLCLLNVQATIRTGHIS